MTFVLLAIGGVLGALCRFHGARLIQARTQSNFPLGTFLINLTGSFVLGLGGAWVARHPGDVGTALALFLGTGFCGAYTTFSSFGFETIQLWRERRAGQAFINLLGQPVLGTLAAFAGLLIGTAIG